MSNNSYHYFATHQTNNDIINRLKAGADYENLEDGIQEKITQLVKGYYTRDKSLSFEEYCLRFIESNKELLEGLINELKIDGLKTFLINYIGYSGGWGASSKSYGGGSKQTAIKISEQDLIKEMTDPKASIKGLLDAARGNLSIVKPFLPAIMISLNTNTRDRSIMKFEHTGRFCFDIDKLKDTNEALRWLNKIWKGTKNIKPYFAFVSPRGKGIKVFCQVDTNSLDFKRDFTLEERKPVMDHHKVWYEGARKEIVTAFPELEEKFDTSTNDPQRLTYLPFIADEQNHFKYDPNRFSDYNVIASTEIAFQDKELKQKMADISDIIKKVKQEQNFTSDIEAYKFHLKNKSQFDIDFEQEKLIKTIDFIEDLINKDQRVYTWVAEKFSNYKTLNDLAWVLFGVFDDLGIEQIKRLIPSDSNKLNEVHSDYRWAIKSEKNYSDNQLANLTPAAFYKLIREQDKINDFLNENYSFHSSDVQQLKLLRELYEIYIRNRNLFDKDDEQADLSDFLDRLTEYLIKKRTRLPLIEDLENLESEIQLDKKEYLDKLKMEDLFQKKYKNKRVFYLRSQCGTILTTVPS
ncbi:BT4734/BF3469 family protein [Polaribacter vadi]|uniref:BT4734/BF3469 family protein n=1 Tax=Polaribacter vadi TaxID=1774273 RepID=UPI0030ED15D9|tara:strand:+ start:74448 stop:76181 length:1734 start_codon:yes stop_codon:yes gene_type:complete